jgi:hypothetical protein
MKTSFLLLCLFVSLGAPAVVAQLPAATGHNFLLDVENKGAGGKVKGSLYNGVYTGGSTGNTGTSTSTATQSQNHSTTLEITIRSQDKTPTQIQVEWYFFARQIQNTRVSKESLFDSGNKTVTIQPTGSEIFDVTSKAVQTATSRNYVTTSGNDPTTNAPYSNTSAVGPDTRSGTKISGWVVRILVNGTVIDAKGSEFKYEDAAKDPVKFEELRSGK